MPKVQATTLKKQRLLFVLGIGIIALFIIFMTSGTSFPQDKSQLSKGVLHLNDSDLTLDGNLNLDGEWAFYWNQLLSYHELQTKTPDLFVEIPNVWNGYQINGQQCAGQGYATYALHVQTKLPAGLIVGLQLNSFSSAYQLYINEKLVASNGRVGKNNFEERPEYRPQSVVFAIPDTALSHNSFDIILHVSNFNHATGGFWKTIYMGNSATILAEHELIIAQAFFILGMFFFTGIFFIFLFFLRQELTYTIYFAIVCFLGAFAVDMSCQAIATNFIFKLNYYWLNFIWYASTTWIWFFWLLFLHTLYHSKFSKLLLTIYLCISIFSQILYTFTKPVFYTRFLYIWYAIEIVTLIGTAVVVLIGIKKKNDWVGLNLICIVILLTIYLYDVLYWTNIVNHNWIEFSALAVAAFMMIQIFIQALRVKQFYDEKIAAELSFLQSQIKPHFLYNTLNTFVSISRYDVDKARNLIIDFSEYLRRSFDFKSLGQLVPIENEILLAQYYTQIEQIRFEDRCNVVFDIDLDLKTDRTIRVPLLVLQPLIENALIHGILVKSEGGRVDVSIKKNAKNIIFSVQDNGVGMDSKCLEMLRSKDLYKEKKLSVGIANIDSRLHKLYGKGLQIQSTLGVGTLITWQVRV
ncbi:MAG: histidine kinase [Desulfobacterales bacterium]|nr:histidine kinase [Desulfobacterales bacterium]